MSFDLQVIAMTEKKQVTALILAGGKSSRFGTDKAYMKLNNRLVVNILANEAAKVCDQVIIVSDTGRKFAVSENRDLREIADLKQGLGPMGGLQSGLIAAKNHTCLLMACDMPLVNADLMNLFIEKSAGFDVVLPQVGVDIEPMFGIYKKSILPVVDKCIAEKRRSLLNLVKAGKTLFLTEDIWESVAQSKEVFFNINYLKDYEDLLKGDADHQKQTDRKDFYTKFINELEE